MEIKRGQPENLDFFNEYIIRYNTITLPHILYYYYYYYYTNTSQPHSQPSATRSNESVEEELVKTLVLRLLSLWKRPSDRSSRSTRADFAPPILFPFRYVRGGERGER